MKTKTVIEMDYNEFEELVKKVYGRKWSFVADQELRNDTSWTCRVEKEELDEFELSDIEKFKQGELHTYLANTLLTDLVNNGHLQPGDYLIEVCW